MLWILDVCACIQTPGHSPYMRAIFRQHTELHTMHSRAIRPLHAHSQPHMSTRACMPAYLLPSETINEISSRVLKGWALLGIHCPICSVSRDIHTHTCTPTPTYYTCIHTSTVLYISLYIYAYLCIHPILRICHA